MHLRSRNGPIEALLFYDGDSKNLQAASKGKEPVNVDEMSGKLPRPDRSPPVPRKRARVDVDSSENGGRAVADAAADARQSLKVMPFYSAPKNNQIDWAPKKIPLHTLFCCFTSALCCPRKVRVAKALPTSYACNFARHTRAHWVHCTELQQTIHVQLCHLGRPKKIWKLDPVIAATVRFGLFVRSRGQRRGV